MTSFIFMESTGATAVTAPLFGEGTGAILLDDVECIGTEQRLVDCPHPGIGVLNSLCDHSDDAGVICGNNRAWILPRYIVITYNCALFVAMEPMPVNCTDGDVRLIGGSSPDEGTVEICINKVFGSICEGSLTTRTADVVCKQLGYPTIGIDSNRIIIVTMAEVE